MKGEPLTEVLSAGPLLAAAVKGMRSASQPYAQLLAKRVREKLGATYSPSAGVQMSSAYPGWGYAMGGAEVKPEDVDRVIAAFQESALELVQAGLLPGDASAPMAHASAEPVSAALASVSPAAAVRAGSPPASGATAAFPPPKSPR